MDYLVEIALHPDLLEALAIQRRLLVKLARHPDFLETIAVPRSLKSATALCEVDFLATEHPNAWIAEVVHTFYTDPAFASRVWVSLRYCVTFRRALAERVFRDQAAWLPWRTASAGVKQLAAQGDFNLDHFKEKPVDAIQTVRYYLKFHKVVDTLCGATGMHPEPPRFLSDLMDALAVADRDRDGRTKQLLQDPWEVRRLARDNGIGVPFSLVQEDELEQIRQTRAAVHRTQGPDGPGPLHSSGGHSARQALDSNLMGLTFSGGGIRSATFNLGVLQALSKIGLLKHVDYLSTVSGGGYIGSWLAAWIHRESLKHDEPAAVIAEVQRRLSPTRSPNPLDERLRPIRFLREYSNYLTPRTGFFSTDTWTMLGIYFRNALLNQVIIVSLFAALLLVPRALFALAHTHRLDPGAWLVLPGILWVVGAALLVVNLRRLDPRSSETLVQIGAPMMPAPADVRPPWYAQPRVIQAGVVLPWLFTSTLLVSQWGEWAVSNVRAASQWVGLLLGVSILLILLFGRSHRCWTSLQAGVKPGGEAVLTISREAVLTIIGSAAVAGAVAGGLTWVLLKLLLLVPSSGEREWHLIALGTAGLLSVLSLAIVALRGMLGEKFPDEHREWWSRVRTFIHVYAIGWLAWYVAAVYVPWGIDLLSAQDLGWKSGSTAIIAWIASTVFGVKKGQTAEEDCKQQREAPSAPSGVSATMLRWAALAAPFVFIVGLIVLISVSIDAMFRQYLPGELVKADYWRIATWTTQQSPWAWTLACVAVGLLFSWRVDINEFSIHHFYKNRLVRCYLGASRTTERKADWFTGFDPNDDVRLTDFDNIIRFEKKEKCYQKCYPGPYPILNCALNLVGGQDLAWQERKATSFVFTPKHCGYDLDRAVLTKTGNGQRSEAYVPTKSYYRRGQGPLLGMAMAISGAAANPNMGRATSPASAFLMTVFNVRLGWWIGNPRHEAGSPLPGPRLGLTYTALELFGGTDDSRKFVNLSDGGHFDNLGVYELIRRGCRYIVVCDAGQDGRMLCEDLGDLVRRCRTDFGVEIDIAVDRIRERDAHGMSKTHCVVGKIHYLNMPLRDEDGRLLSEDGGRLVRGSRRAHEEGYIVYIKPSMTGDEPQDVLEYYRRIPEFPHQSTADQWFGESQFESYRTLGMHIGEQTFARYRPDDAHSVGDLQHLFKRLYRHWYPPSLAINERSTMHAAEYSRIMELVRTQDRLHGLDRAMFDALPAASAPTDPRDEFYVCNALVQLIENVYADLELEHNWDHPHVQGWMRVFKRWAQQPAFRRTWKIAESTYAERFRNFYNDRLYNDRLRGRSLGLPHRFIAWHRGRVLPADLGNTMEAFEAAITAGAAVIKLDVSKLSGELIVYHDQDLERRPIVSGDRDTLSQVVTVLPLANCLKKLRGRIQLDLELKTPGIAAEVIKALRASKWREYDYVLTLFDGDMIKEAREVNTEVRFGLLIRDRGDYDRAFKAFLDLDADFLAPDERMLNDEDLHHADEAKVPLVPWSVNTADRLRMFLTHGAVAGVITDDLPLALRVKSQT